MPQQRPKKGQTPINSDAFNLVPDLATINDTSGVVVSVADRTEADSIASALAAAGWPVTDARPLYVWNLSTNSLEVKVTAGWKGGIKPFGHMGKTDGFQPFTGGPNRVTFGAAQILRGGVTFSDTDDALVVPVAGLYRITAQFYTTGTGGGTELGLLYTNSVNQTGITTRHYKEPNNDTQSTCTGVIQLAAGDKVQMYAQLVGTSVSTWGTASHNGDWVEVEFMDQW